MNERTPEFSELVGEDVSPEERSRLVYRIKVSADNRNGLFKPGMPVEAELPLK